jgi:hypothetical protein
LIPGREYQSWDFQFRMEMTWSNLSIVVTQLELLLNSECADLQVPDVNIQGLMTCKCYLAYILMQLMCVHVCSRNHMHWGEPCRGLIMYVDVPNSY